MSVDMAVAYRVDGYPGAAFRVIGYAQVWEPATTLMIDPETGEEREEAVPGEGEHVADPHNVRAVMIGDDREHVVPVSDLTPIDRDDYCGQCGQIGCAHDGRD